MLHRSALFHRAPAYSLVFIFGGYCNHHEVVPLCTPFISHAEVKANRNIIIEIGSNESSIYDSIGSFGRLDHFRRVLATSTTYKTTYPRCDLSYILMLPEIRN